MRFDDRFQPAVAPIASEPPGARPTPTRGRRGDWRPGDLRSQRGYRDSGPVASPIPEASSVLMFAAGAGLIALLARRKTA